MPFIHFFFIHRLIHESLLSSYVVGQIIRPIFRVIWHSTVLINPIQKHRKMKKKKKKKKLTFSSTLKLFRDMYLTLDRKPGEVLVCLNIQKEVCQRQISGTRVFQSGILASHRIKERFSGYLCGILTTSICKSLKSLFETKARMQQPLSANETRTRAQSVKGNSFTAFSARIVVKLYIMCVIYSSFLKTNGAN